MKTVKETTDLVRYEKYFSDGAFWVKVRKYAKKAGLKVAYLAVLLYYVLKNPDTPNRDKAVIVGALGYFILPVDLMPDLIPGLGLADDFSALVLAFRAVSVNVNPVVREQTKVKLREWFGEYDEAELKNLG